jgi:hypothetical protein
VLKKEKLPFLSEARLKYSPFVALALLTCPAAAYAGAWPQAAGGGQLINTFSYYEVNVQGYNSIGKPAGHGSYTQLELAPYLEYGLTDRWTIGAQPRVQYLKQTGLPSTGHSFGLVQFNMFARYTIFHDDWNAVSAQGQLGIPGTSTEAPPELAQPNAEYEARLLYGHAFTLPNGWPGFLDTEGAYRLESNGNASQVRADATIGITPVTNWMILAQNFNTISVGTAVPGSIDYNLNRVELSVLRTLGRRFAVQFGAWDDVDGRNISLGDAGIAAVWVRF